ncbi:hypothetical protein V3C99_018623 [Haemonchus contortus]
MGLFPTPQRPFERVHTDVIGPLPQCTDGSKFISIINTTTGYSPFFVVHGRCPITWSDILHELPPRPVFASDDFADQFAVGLQNIIITVGNEIATKTAQYKTGYDLQNKVYTTDISIGDLVLLHDDTVRPKLTNRWKGPFVVEIIDRPNIAITNLLGRQKRQLVHIDRLKLNSARSKSANTSISDAPNRPMEPAIEEAPAVREQPPIRRSNRLQEKRRNNANNL